MLQSLEWNLWLAVWGQHWCIHDVWVCKAGEVGFRTGEHRWREKAGATLQGRLKWGMNRKGEEPVSWMNTLLCVLQSQPCSCNRAYSSIQQSSPFDSRHAAQPRMAVSRVSVSSSPKWPSTLSPVCSQPRCLCSEIHVWDICQRGSLCPFIGNGTGWGCREHDTELWLS